MRQDSSIAVVQSRSEFARAWCALAIVFGLGTQARAQGDAPQPPEIVARAAGCTLKDHVYTCDGAAFQRALAASKTIAIQTQNWDGVAKGQLIDLITRKLGKTVASKDGPAELIFLLIPIGQQGVHNIPGNDDLGTIRVYTMQPDGSRGHILWAEMYSGQEDTPWPAVVRSLILQFEARFHIK